MLAVSSEKSIAIVLKLVDFSETSVVTTLFTREFGKISALAKGARRPKGPFEAALDLLAICRIVFIHKSSDALDLLTEAKLERRFRAASRDLSRLYAGYYVAELLRELTDTGDPHLELFQAANQALFDLDSERDVRHIVLEFELTALRLLGHLPSLDLCTGCGVAMNVTGRVSFGQLAGGLLCDRCKLGKRQVVSVSLETVQALRFFSAENKEDREAVLGSFSYGEVRGLLNRYLANLMGRPLRMHRYLVGP
jgi:DNA repair protein RecO (recombination protein O)